jgi:hypothetical protein
MKKVLIIATFLLAASSSAFATDLASGSVSAEGATIYSSATAPTPVVKLSTGVAGAAVFNSSSYAIYTKHTKGSKVFGTAADSTSIWFKLTGSGILGATGSTFDTTSSLNAVAFASGWTTY